MSYGYPTDKSGLSSLLAQLLEPPTILPRAGAGDDELTEESDLARMLRMLLGPDRSKFDPKQA